METLFEKYVAENYALAAFALYAASHRFRESTTLYPGLSLEQALLVPPMVFHRKTADAFAKTMRTDGLFYRVLTENVQLTIGLQDRLQDSSERSMRTIHFGASTKILFIEKKPEFRVCASIFDRPGTTFGKKGSKEVKQLLQAADRIGYCLATTEFPLVCAALRISF